MRKDLEEFYETFDEKMKKIKKKLKRNYPEDNKQPILFNFDEVPFWFYKKPQTTYDFKGTHRVCIANYGGGKNEKERFTLILGATTKGKLYPPIVILSGGKNPGIEWKPSKIEIQKDPKAAEKL